MESRLILVCGHESRNILNKFPLVGAVLRKKGYLLTTEHRKALTAVARASVALNEEYGEDNILVVPHHYNLNQKIKWINEHSLKTDYLLSVHLNSSIFSEVNGSEVWFYGEIGDREETPSGKQAKKLASLQSLVLNTKDRGIWPDKESRHKRLGIIRDTRPWAFLTELGFLSNEEDLKKIENKGVQAVIELSKHLLNGKS